MYADTGGRINGGLEEGEDDEDAAGGEDFINCEEKVEEEEDDDDKAGFEEPTSSPNAGGFANCPQAGAEEVEYLMPSEEMTVEEEEEKAKEADEELEENGFVFEGNDLDAPKGLEEEPKETVEAKGDDIPVLKLEHLLSSLASSSSSSSLSLSSSSQLSVDCSISCGLSAE